MRPFPVFSGLPSPPMSPRQRRTHLRASDDVSGELTIEEYIYRSDPYRSTSQLNPFPYPISSRPADPDITEKVHLLKDEIIQILDEDNFPPSVGHLGFLVEEVTKPEYPSGDTPITCLRLAYHNAPYFPNRPGGTRSRIMDLLATRGIQGVHVEIVALNMCFKPSLFAISPADPAVRVYAAAKRNILEVAQFNLDDEWCMIGLYNAGLTKAKALPTVVVYVSPFAVANWQDLCHQIQLCLAPSDAGVTNIQVEFLPGKLSDLTPDYSERKEPGHNGRDLDHMLGDSALSPGMSITVPHEQGGGTLGPFINLTTNNKTWKAAITNFHVVRPSSRADPEVQKMADRFGFDMSTRASSNRDVVYWSPRDIETTTFWVETRLDENKKALKTLEEKIAIKEAMGEEVGKGLEHGVQYRAELNKEYEKKLSILNKMPMKLGSVLLASGKQIVSNRVADWAVVDVEVALLHNPSARHINLMPFISRANLGKERDVVKEGTILDNFGDLECGSWFCKKGRTTDVTGGICTGISTYCRWPDASSRQRWTEDGRRSIYIEDGVTEEFVVLAESSTIHGTMVQSDFCADGDSGSGIIDVYGCICGLLYASAVSFCGPDFGTRSGICSTMSDVRQWIEKRATPKDGPPAVVSLPH